MMLTRTLTSLYTQSRTLLRSRRWRAIFLAGTLTASVVVVLLALWNGWRELHTYPWQYDWASLALSGGAYSLSLLGVLLGWVVLMRALGARSSWRQDAKCFLYSWMARRLPTPAPYIATRMLLYEEIGVPKRVVTMGLLWETLLLITSGLLLLLLLLPFAPLVNEQIAVLPLLLASGLSVVVLLRPAWLADVANWVLHRVGKERTVVPLRPAMIGALLLTYSGVWLAGGLILFLLTRAVFPLPWETLPLVLQSWVLSGLLSYLAFWLPVRLGFRDMTLAALLALTLPFSVAVVIVLLMRLWVMVNELLWAALVSRL